jgi:putative tricarboxylic transport membrane protein
VLLAGLILWGLQPGPLLFKEHPEFVWPLIGSFYVSNFAGLVMNLALIPLFLWMLRMPFTILAASIFVLSTVGTYAATTASFDLWLMLGFGVAAFFLRILDYPLAPCVLALVLGPIVEPALSRSLQFSDGDPSIFFTRPIAGPIMIIAIVLILLPVLRRGWQLLRQAPAGG